MKQLCLACNFYRGGTSSGIWWFHTTFQQDGIHRNKFSKCIVTQPKMTPLLISFTIFADWIVTTIETMEEVCPGGTNFIRSPGAVQEQQNYTQTGRAGDLEVVD